jgi:uncharacterized protein YrrD
MLKSIRQLLKTTLGASDGEIGHVKDFYFDDQSWAIRYLIADTGSWLPKRKVLIAPHAFGDLYQSGKRLLVNLSRQQIENSPSIESHKPVSRQYEEEYYRYFNWPYYWQGDQLWGLSGVPILETPPESLPSESAAANVPKSAPSDTHLRSTLGVSGHHINATGETVGHICDFLMDTQTWAILYLVVKTGHRISGNEVEIPASSVDRINYDESTVFVNLTKEAVEQSQVHHLEPDIPVTPTDFADESNEPRNERR